MSSRSEQRPTGRRLGANRHFEVAPVAPDVRTTLHQLRTLDDALIAGVLFCPAGARSVITISHPRVDSNHHVMIPFLCKHGFAVWAQGTRTVGNDLTLVYENALLDLAAGFTFLNDLGFDHLIPLGHSGGGALNAYYIQQAGVTAEHRVHTTPGGRPCLLPEAQLPLPDGLVLLAPHPGQADLLANCIDPSVTDESDPLSVDPSLDPYNPANGFSDPPIPSRYTPEFISGYRAAQQARIARIDQAALALATRSRDAKARFSAHGDPGDKRASVASPVITVYRTDADPRCVDLSLDPSDRPYGSLFGRRPDVINYGILGFGRLSTPEAWLSTWSANHSLAGFRRCGDGVRVPTLLLQLTGDQGAFPADTAAIFADLGSTDKTHRLVRGLHFGGPLPGDERSGAETASELITAWIRERFV